MSKVTIEIPPGYELVQTGEGKWEMRKIKLPKTWEEFCRMNPINSVEHFIHNNSEIDTFVSGRKRDAKNDRNFLPTRRLAEAMLALCQLIQLRNFYNGDWVPDWSSANYKYIISCQSICGKIKLTPDVTFGCPRVLVFRSGELRNQFLENFRDLIEIAKPLI